MVITGRAHCYTFCIYRDFLWGYLKHKILDVEHDQQPTNLRQLREAVVPACETLDQQIIQNAFDGMVSRAHRCIRSLGGAFADE